MRRTGQAQLPSCSCSEKLRHIRLRDLAVLSHYGALIFKIVKKMEQSAVAQQLGSSTPQNLAQSNPHRKAVPKRFPNVKNFEFEFPTVFRLHNDIFKFSNFENRFFERRIPQRTDQVPWLCSGLA